MLLLGVTVATEALKLLEGIDWRHYGDRELDCSTDVTMVIQRTPDYSSVD